jgi:hypothetical protein
VGQSFDRNKRRVKNFAMYIEILTSSGTVLLCALFKFETLSAFAVIVSDMTTAKFNHCFGRGQVPECIALCGIRSVSSSTRYIEVSEFDAGEKLYGYWKGRNVLNSDNITFQIILFLLLLNNVVAILKIETRAPETTL